MSEIAPDSCNAVEKQGRLTLVCEKALGHDPGVPARDREHQMGEHTWKDRGGW